MYFAGQLQGLWRNSVLCAVWPYHCGFVLPVPSNNGIPLLIAANIFALRTFNLVARLEEAAGFSIPGGLKHEWAPSSLSRRVSCVCLESSGCLQRPFHAALPSGTTTAISCYQCHQNNRIPLLIIMLVF